MTPGRSWLVLTDGYLTTREAKTADGVFRYARDPIACVLDSEYAGKNLSDVMPELRRDAPIVASLSQALEHRPTSLLLGVATPGGWIPDHWRAVVKEGIQQGLEIVNGLHGFLKDDPELVELAQQNDVRLWDVRDPPSDIPLCSGTAVQANQRIVHTVGSDCAVGKMSVSLELAACGASAGVRTEFVATGQTGILIAGRGIAVDRVISDFLSGAAERTRARVGPELGSLDRRRSGRAVAPGLWSGDSRIALWMRARGARHVPPGRSHRDRRASVHFASAAPRDDQRLRRDGVQRKRGESRLRSGQLQGSFSRRSSPHDR